MLISKDHYDKKKGINKYLAIYCIWRNENLLVHEQFQETFQERFLQNNTLFISVDRQIVTSFTQWVGFSLSKDVKFEAKKAPKLTKKELIRFTFHFK